MTATAFPLAQITVSFFLQNYCTCNTKVVCRLHKIPLKKKSLDSCFWTYNDVKRLVPWIQNVNKFADQNKAVSLMPKDKEVTMPTTSNQLQMYRKRNGFRMKSLKMPIVSLNKFENEVFPLVPKDLILSIQLQKYSKCNGFSKESVNMPMVSRNATSFPNLFNQLSLIWNNLGLIDKLYLVLGCIWYGVDLSKTIPSTLPRQLLSKTDVRINDVSKDLCTESPTKTNLQEEQCQQVCVLCNESVRQKKFFGERRFAILENCDCIICYGCIQKVNRTSNWVVKGPVQCPVCLVISDNVASNALWIKGEEKVKFFKEYYMNSWKLCEQKGSCCSTGRNAVFAELPKLIC